MWLFRAQVLAHPAPPIDAPLPEPTWMTEAAEAMVAPGWLERQALAAELFPPWSRTSPWLTKEQRKAVQRTLNCQLRHDPREPR